MAGLLVLPSAATAPFQSALGTNRAPNDVARSMKVRIALILIGIVGLFTFVGFGMGWFGPKVSDEDQIRVALQDSIRASREGRGGGVLEYLSREFEVNGNKYGTGAIADQVRKTKPDVTVMKTEPNVIGQLATLDSPVELSLTLPNMKFNLSKVHFVFEKEESRKWGLFPAHEWKLSKVEVPDEVFGELESTYGGF